MSAEIWSKVKHFVGLNEDIEEIYEEEEEMTVEKRPAKPTRNIVGLPSPVNSEVVVIEPHSFEDALGLIDHIRSRRAVIVNLFALTAEQSQRLVDFVSGACHALDGHQERIGDNIFLFTPSNVAINALHDQTAWMGKQTKDLFWRVNAN
ncbi:MAG: cell division protein SepF [Bacteroidota bacterium]